ncbi:hypothetical protein QBC45DRAFT_468521 [Copromyces sp. CBS 386.78]|nr:hypothetical protein QBC45DRAFT_468521 [Copromyces sp. CBS 386.78]
MRHRELLSPVTNADIVSTLRQLSNCVSQLGTRVGEISSRVDSLEALFAAGGCRYDTEEAEHVFGHIENRIDDSRYDLRYEIKDTIEVKVEECVAEEVQLQGEEFRMDMETKWVGDLRDEVAEQVTSEVKEKISNTKHEVTREVVKEIAEVLMSAYQASQVNQDGSSSAPFNAPATALPGETAVRAAVENIQDKHKDELTGEEMTEVLDLLVEHPLKAVSYNACVEEMKRACIIKWKKEVSGWGVFRPI